MTIRNEQVSNIVALTKSIITARSLTFEKAMLTLIIKAATDAVDIGFEGFTADKPAVLEATLWPLLRERLNGESK